MRDSKENDHTESEEKSIAIIGMGCRFPKSISSPDEFWDSLINGVDGISDVPKSRWDIRKYYDEDINKPGKMYIKQAGFLQQRLDEYDPLFFGISPREADMVDPMQRLLMEVTWEAFEHAGLTEEAIAKQKTGVFMGGFALDNKTVQLDSMNQKIINSHSALGITLALLSNRLSYVFDLTGPSISIDTACSSSMMAVHYAIQSIRNGDCEMALVGGANTMLTPGYPIAMCKGQFLSHHSRCKTFSADAAGYVRAEGAGVLVLKSLQAAKNDGDNIHAVILESGVNQDGGQTNGISLPNPKAQEELIRTVYKRAGVAADKIDYIEAHGTGTKAGDPLELSAIANVMENRDLKSPCLVGSVKTNIGHMEAASAVAALMKTTFALKYKSVPPNLHFNEPNPAIPFDEIPLEVATETTALPADAVNYAGVNSFGYGGSNGHALLRSPHADEISPFVQKSEQDRTWLVPVSARSQGALKALAQSYSTFLLNDLAAENKYVMEDIVYSLGCRRTQHKFRAAVIARDKKDLADKLARFSAGEFLDTVIDDQATTGTSNRKINFVCTGMGPQWWKMGRELYASEPVFKREMDRIEEAFVSTNGWSVLAEMQKSEEESRMAETEVAQPANFYLQASLAKLFESWGIVANSVIGHSVGEVTSAYLTGALSLRDAVLISHCRSHWQQKCNTLNGGMLAVGLSEDKANGYITGFDKVEVAAINSVDAVTLAGDKNQLQEIAERLTAEEVFNRFLKVDIAYHSSQMDGIENELKAALSSVSPRKTHTPLYSTVTGKLIDGETLDGEYWWLNVRQPVRFAECMEQLINDQQGDFLEVGPHPVLQSSIKECLQRADEKRAVIPTLNRKVAEQLSFYASLAKLYMAGAGIDWTAFATAKPQFLDLPTYPWQREYYWHETDASIEHRIGRPGYVYFNETLRGPLPAWQCEVNKYLLPYLQDHQIEGMVVFPGAGYADVALALHHEVYTEQPCTVENLTIHSMLVVQPTQVPVIQSSIDPDTGLFSIHSRDSGMPDSDWKLHASGKILAEPLSREAIAVELEDLKARHTETVEVEQFYRNMDSRGLNYGHYFRPIRKIMRNSTSVMLEIETVEEVATEEGEFILHPTILDASFQSIVILIDDGQGFVPTGMERFDLYRAPGRRCWSIASLCKRSKNSLICDIRLVDENGDVLAAVHQLKCQALPQKSAAQSGENIWLYEYEWRKQLPLKANLSELLSQQLLVLASGSEFSQLLLQRLDEMDVNYVAFIQGSHYAKTDLNKITLDAASEEQLQQAFASVPYLKPTNIVDLWDYDSAIESDTPTSALVGHSMAMRNMLSALQQQEQTENTDWLKITSAAQALLMGESAQNIAVSPLLGLGPLVVNEFPNILCRTLDLDAGESAANIEILLAEVLEQDSETEIAYRQSERYVRRLTRYEANTETEQEKEIPATEPARLRQQRHGQLDSLVFESADREQPAGAMVEIKVNTAALNFADVLAAGGEPSAAGDDNSFFSDSLGREVSGVISAVGENTKWKVGDEVIALTSDGGFQTYVTVSDDFVVSKPPSLSFAQAANFLAFMTAWQALDRLAQLKAGETVLIHNASGGVGLAAVSIAKQAGAQIFATAGSDEKREFLRTAGIEHVMDSRSLAFYDQVLEATQGRGVDVVLNTLSGEARTKSAQLVKSFGRFVDIGTRQAAGGEAQPYDLHRNNLTLMSVDMDSMLLHRPQEAKELMQEVAELFNSTEDIPEPLHCFAANDAVGAFQLMQQHRHIGKVALSFDGATLTVKRPKQHSWLKADSTYLVTGGTRGFGLNLALWLAQQGASQLVLASRSGGSSNETQAVIEKIEALGCKTFVRAVDIADKQAVQQLFTEFDQPRCPLRGVFHSAGVLDDGFITSLDASQFERVISPKVEGAWNIHYAEQKLECSVLDVFVLFSSVSSLIGNAGQANYVVANTFYDNFAFYRRAMGLNATAINWGALADSGMVARDDNVEEILAEQGITPIDNGQALHQMSEALEVGAVQLGIVDLDWNLWFQANPSSKKSKRFADMFGLIESASETGPLKELYDKLRESTPEERLAAMELAVKEQIADLLRYPMENISADEAVSNLGVDSLVASELSTRLKNELGMSVSSIMLLNSPSISHLVQSHLSEVFAVDEQEEEQPMES